MSRNQMPAKLYIVHSKRCHPSKETREHKIDKCEYRQEVNKRLKLELGYTLTMNVEMLPVDLLNCMQSLVHSAELLIPILPPKKGSALEVEEERLSCRQGKPNIYLTAYSLQLKKISDGSNVEKMHYVEITTSVRLL
jgi:hypothetical protein